MRVLAAANTVQILRVPKVIPTRSSDLIVCSDLSLTVTRGRRLAILGPNGAGKTTLLLHLNGTLRPTSGRVLLDGEPGIGAVSRSL